MKNIVRRIAVVIGAAALSVGLLGATSAPASAASGPRLGDSSWAHG